MVDKMEPLNYHLLPMQQGGAGAGGPGGPGGMGGGRGGGQQTQNRNSTERIFLGGLPPALDEAKLRELMSAFGALKSLNIVRGVYQLHPCDCSGRRCSTLPRPHPFSTCSSVVVYFAFIIISYHRRRPGRVSQGVRLLRVREPRDDGRRCGGGCTNACRTGSIDEWSACVGDVDGAASDGHQLPTSTAIPSTVAPCTS